MSRGVIILPTQTMHYYKGESLKITIDLHCLIPPKWVIPTIMSIYVYIYMGVNPKIGEKNQNGWFISWKTQFKMDDLGGPPLFLETSIFIRPPGKDHISYPTKRENGKLSSKMQEKSIPRMINSLFINIIYNSKQHSIRKDHHHTQTRCSQQRKAYNVSTGTAKEKDFAKSFSPTCAGKG